MNFGTLTDVPPAGLVTPETMSTAATFTVRILNHGSNACLVFAVPTDTNEGVFVSGLLPGLDQTEVALTLDLFKFEDVLDHRALASRVGEDVAFVKRAGNYSLEFPLERHGYVSLLLVRSDLECGINFARRKQFNNLQTVNSTNSDATFRFSKRGRDGNILAILEKGSEYIALLAIDECDRLSDYGGHVATQDVSRTVHSGSGASNLVRMTLQSEDDLLFVTVLDTVQDRFVFRKSEVLYAIENAYLDEG